MAETKKWPGECDTAYPDVYNKPPPFPDVLKPGQLNQEQFDQFFHEGYLLIEEFFTGDEIEVLEECREGVRDEVEKMAQKLYKAGKIKNLYADKGIFQRLTCIDKEFPGANILLHKLGVFPKYFRNLHSHPKLLNLAEQILGTSNVNGSPNWNIRVKTPNTDAATVPWHQDNGYDSNEMYSKMVLTGWIPLLDTNEQNGCLQMARYGHKSGKVGLHTCCWKGTWYVELDEDEMKNNLGVDIEKDIITCPVPYGGILIFSNMLPHRSLNNASTDIRWSLDLRWLSGDEMTTFHGLKECVKLRSENDPEMKIDWDTFNAVDRHKTSEGEFGIVLDEFDTIIMGPWMKKWEMTQTNRHTEAYEKQEASGQQGPVYAP